MAKGDGPNKREEFFYKLSLKPEFEQDLKAARKELGVPESCFSLEKERQQWFNEPHGDMRIFDIMFRLQKKYNIPVSYFLALDDYLFFGKADMMTTQKPTVAVIEPPAHTLDPGDVDMEEFYHDNHEPYAKLLVFGNGRKSDVIKFIEKNWGRVEEILKKQGWSRPKKVRQTIYKDRNKRIKELWRISTKKLRENAREKDPDSPFPPSKYKDLLIQQVLKEEGYGNVNEGYIRKTGTEK